MSANSKTRTMKWIPSEDMETIAKLCGIFNQGNVYEIFWEYCGLNAEILSKKEAYGWLYYENGKLSGFALSRRRQGVARMNEALVFEEVWGPCDGISSELVALSRRDRKRALQFKKLISSLDFGSSIVLRAAADNQFAHMVARSLKARWVNGLIIAERKLDVKFDFDSSRI